MSKTNKIEIIVEAVDRATGTLGKITKALGGMAPGAAIATGAIIAGGAAVGKYAYDLASAAVPVEQVKNTFDSLTDSVNVNSEDMLNGIRKATNGMVSDYDLMTAANKFLSMGLADSTEEVADLVNMGTQLSMAMGTDATQGALDLAMMLANQSIPRLDNFGISSANVRERINELTEADKNLTYEEAFMQAVMEEGTNSMQRVGDQSGSTAGQMAQLKAMIDNLKATIGTALLPILGSLAETLSPIITEIGPTLIGIAGTLATVFTSSVVPALAGLVEKLLPSLNAILPPILEIFGQLATDLLGSLVPAILDLINAFLPIINMILPPLISLVSTLVSWLFSQLIPVVSALADWLGKALPVAFKFLSDLWKNTLQPALQGLWTFLTKVWEAFVKIGEAVKKVIQFFKDLVAGIKNIKLPDWLTPGSPTPFEMGLRGIADALNEVNGMTASAFSGLPNDSSVGSGGSERGYNQAPIFELHIHTPINLADRTFAERELMPYIEAGVRQLMARSA